MSEPHCYGSLQTVALRVAQLDVNGSPDDGAANGYVTDAVIDVTLGADIEEGDEFVLKNGSGAICQTYRGCDRMKRATIEMNLCQLDAELLQLLIGGSVIRDLSGAGVGDAIGYEVADVDDACPYGVCLELWTLAWDGSEQATPPFAGGNTIVYWHFVLPRAKFQIGDLTIENDFLTVPVTGFSEANSRVTSNGPFNDWPADIVSRGGITKPLGFFLDSTVPTPTCDRIAVTSLAS